MKVYKILILLLISSLTATAQLNKLGHPIIRNYTPEEYGATEQNWSVIQDNRGVLYVGNGENGVLEYDGKTWRKIPIPNNSEIRSLAKDDEGTIYVGAIGEFGYLKPNQNGEMQYVSLNTFKDSIKISSIYKTYFYNNKIYFCTSKYIITYDKQKTSIINIDKKSESSNFFSFIVHNQFYVGSFVKGLTELLNDSLVSAPNGSFFKEKDIFFMLPLEQKNALVGTGVGFFIYNQNTGEVKPYHDKQNLTTNLLKEGVSYHALIQPNGNFGFAFPQSTSYNYLEVNKNGVPIEAINPSIGLKDGAITYLYNSTSEKQEQPLWLTHFNGISRSETQSAIRRFGEESGINGIINDIKRFNGALYLATLDGLYKQVFENGFYRFVQEPQVTSNTWSLEIFNNPETHKKSLMVASLSGLYEITENGNIKSISEPFKKDKINIVGFKVYQSQIDPSVIYIGLQAGLAKMQLKNGGWSCDWLNKKAIRTNIRNIGEDNYGNLWLGTYVDGLIKYNPTSDSVTFYGLKSSLPGLRDILILKLNDELIFSTSKGFYKFDYKENKFAPTSLPDDNKVFDYGINKFARTKNGYILGCYGNSSWYQLVEKDSTGKVIINDIPFKRLPDKNNDGLFVDDDGTIWISKAKELYSFNPNTKRDYSLSYNALIRRVTSKDDSVLFMGSYFKKDSYNNNVVSLDQNPKQILKLPYRLNRLVFEYSATFFEKEEDTEFSYFLEGSDDNWSLWSKKTEATFTNLREGNYVFKVKAKNIYGTESNVATYKFSIAPPWYRTILAWILYSVLFIVLIWVLVRWNTRRLIAEKEELEKIVKERTAEVVAQKDEIEGQKEKISLQNEEITSSIHYASRIQGAILTPNDQIDQIFDDYFILFLPRDIVSGDFYWISKVGNKKICVVADCTGHGVPGGFMSMLGMSFINQIVNKGAWNQSGDILNQLRASIIHALHQTGEVGGSKDGMDIAIYVIDEATNTLEFSGANNPLIHIRGEELNHIKGDKMPIGIHMRANEPFTTTTIQLEPGDCLYTFSDGYADQFGGPEQRKFMIKNLKDLLLEIHNQPMAEQRDRLHKNLLDWHGDSPRIDDVVLMGIRIK